MVYPQPTGLEVLPRSGIRSGCIVAGIFTFIYYRRRYALILTPEGFYNHSTVLDHGNHLILWSVIGDITADRQGKEIRAVIADGYAYN